MDHINNKGEFMSRLIPLSALREVAAASGNQEVHVLGDVGGYRVTVRCGNEQSELAARTREGHVKPRTFRTLNTAARYLREIGLVRYQVDESGFQAAVVKRPDRSAALKKTHEAAAYDHWFREQVRLGIEEADAGRVIGHESVKAWADRRRQKLKARIKARAK